MSSSTGAAVMKMNYESKKNKNILLSRFKSLENFAAWYPLTLVNEWYDGHPGVVPLWDMISLSKEDFKGIVTTQNLWIIKGMKWEKVLPAWGFAYFLTEKHNGTNWVCFHKDAKDIPIAPFCKGNSGLRPIIGSFLFPSAAQPNGFLFKISDEIIVSKKREAELPAESPFRKSLVLDVITPNNVVGAELVSSSSSLSSSSQILEVSFAEIGEFSSDVQSESALSLVGHCDSPTPIISESALLELEESHRQLSVEEQSRAFRLFRALKKSEPNCPDVQTVSFPPSVTGGAFGMKLCSFPSSRASDTDASPSVIKRRANCLSWFIDEIGAGENTVAKLALKEKDAFRKAISTVKRIVLTPEQSLNMQAALHLTNSGVRELKRQLSGFKVPIKIASQAAMMKERDKLQVESAYYENVPMDGTKAKISCLLYAAHMFDIIARDLDQLILTKTFVDWPLTCFSDRENKTVIFVIGNDWGGNSEKWTVSARNSKTPCSATAQSIFCSVQSLRPDEGHKKVCGSYENFERQLAFVHGLKDLHLTIVICIAGQHTLIPKHTLPEEWLTENISAADIPQFSLMNYGGRGTPSQIAAVRAALPEKSAVLVVIGNECIGIRAGVATFPFRTPVRHDTLRPSLVANVQVLNLFAPFCADLLALAVVMGHPGQAGVTSQWHRYSAAGFKEIATLPRNPDVSSALVMRTPQSEKDDLTAYEAQTTKKKMIINGVSRSPLIHQDDFMSYILPALHLALGGANFVCVVIYKVNKYFYFFSL